MQDAPPAPGLEEVQASGWNRRYAVRLADGSRVEAVLYRGDTLCVSCQVGCAVACPFCASGARGLLRGLTLEEMTLQVEQVRVAGHPVARVTVSGVGEPLHNSTVVRAFVDACRERGLPVSLTTSGGPLPRLREWLPAPHNGVTVSVHSGTEETRARMVPRGPSLEALFGVLAEEWPRLSGRRRRKLALAYLVIAGENDGDADVEGFARRVLAVGGGDVRTHVYAYNPVPTSAHQAVTAERYQAICDRLAAMGLQVRRSSQARVDPNGGCGTLLSMAPAPLP
jgi:23S rRNA (adenine2503-C2)-methyltransferase